MAPGVPASFRLGADDRHSVEARAEAYSARHVPQHRDGGHEVALAERLER